MTLDEDLIASAVVTKLLDRLSEADRLRARVAELEKEKTEERRHLNTLAGRVIALFQYDRERMAYVAMIHDSDLVMGDGPFLKQLLAGAEKAKINRLPPMEGS